MSLANIHISARYKHTDYDKYISQPLSDMFDDLR